ETSLAGASLCQEMTSGQRGIRSHHNEVTQPLREQQRLQIASGRVERVRQPAPVIVASLLAGMQSDLATVGLDQGLQSTLGPFREGLGATPLAPELRRVQTYQTYATAINQAQRIAVDHLRHFLNLQRTGRRAGRRRSRGKKRRNEKGAHQGRLSQLLGKSHGLPSRCRLTWRRTRRNAA